MHHEIAWGVVQRMLIDAPDVEDEEETGQGNEVKLTSENADKVLEMINKMNR